MKLCPPQSLIRLCIGTNIMQGWDMNEFNKEANKAHQKETHGHSLRNLDKFKKWNHANDEHHQPLTVLLRHPFQNLLQHSNNCSQISRNNLSLEISRRKIGRFPPPPSSDRCVSHETHLSLPPHHWSSTGHKWICRRRQLLLLNLPLCYHWG